MLRVSAEAQRVRIAQCEVAVAICSLQSEFGLTDVEMLQAVNQWQGTHLKYALRRERNPDNPDKPADEE